MSIDWEPFWIASGPRRLYAALHPAPGASSVGIVMAPPLLHELPRTRRFLTEIAAELAAAGIPCLRFDYHGTGDSSGEGEELDFSGINTDLTLAASALHERTGISRLCVLAWRGSALALHGWAGRAHADLIVLWEPVTDGDAWLRQLTEADTRERTVRPPSRPGGARVAAADDGDLMGFPVSARLRTDLAEARVESARWGRARSWAVMRAGIDETPRGLDRILPLPDNAPAFTIDAAMDATFFLTPTVRELVARLGTAVLTDAAA